MDALPGTPQSDLSATFIDWGAGLDVPLGDRYYLRLQGLYGVSLNPVFTAFKNAYGQQGLTNYSATMERFNIDVALGYKL
jgi:hypothetical protein